MNAIEKVIAEAMSDPTKRDLAEARVACYTAATTKLWCPDCGTILDQRRVVVVETPAKSGVCCSRCFERVRPDAEYLHKMLVDSDQVDDLKIWTWAGRIL